MADEYTEEILAAAIEYARMGYTIIPVKGRAAKDNEDAKKPLVRWEKWLRKSPTEEIIRDWFQQRPLSNIGIVTGAAAGIFLLDVDDAEGQRQVEALGIPSGPYCLTRRGRHYYFKWDKRLQSVSTTRRGVLPSCDTRGEGGFCLVSPSVTPDGYKYKWQDGYERTSLSSLPPTPEWLIQLLLKQEAKAATGPVTPDKANWFDEVYPGVGAGDRHQAMCRLASYYLSRGLPEDDVVALMVAWNERCSPPKEGFEKELDGFIEYWRDGKYASNYEIKHQYKVQSSVDFLGTEEPKIDWLVNGLIPQQTITFLFGYSGLGKSWLTLDLAIEIGRGGGKWLDRLVEGGKVLYVDEESHGKLLRHRYNKLLKGKGIKKEAVNCHFMSLQGIKLDNQDSVDAFKGILVEIQPDIVIYDPFVSCHTLNERDSGDMAKLRQTFKRIISDCGVSLLFIDHSNKVGDVAKPVAQMQRGSSEKGAVADVALALLQQGDMLVLEQAKARYSNAVPPVRVVIEDTNEESTVVRAEVIS